MSIDISLAADEAFSTDDFEDEQIEDVIGNSKFFSPGDVITRYVHLVVV